MCQVWPYLINSDGKGEGCIVGPQDEGGYVNSVIVHAKAQGCNW